jgi:hypothetical protein
MSPRNYVTFAETADGSYPYAGAATVGTCITCGQKHPSRARW